jgi:hypothetical protein
MRKINLNIIFRRFKALSLLICIFVLFGCSPHNTGEKYNLIVTNAGPTTNGECVVYTLVSATKDESLSDVVVSTRPCIQFADEYGKFNIGDTVVIVKNNQYEK